LGDKALVGCVVGALAAQGALPIWVATLIIGRWVHVQLTTCVVHTGIGGSSSLSPLYGQPSQAHLKKGETMLLS